MMMEGIAPLGDLCRHTGSHWRSVPRDGETAVDPFGFDYAMLVDPSAVSPLKGNLSLSEVMYNPMVATR
ncbi:MAG: hypothetical protein CM1200mP29_01220 [Verrucomicrobiota bacterium]|nr:MAG: hypothetical protein CM1200mP29_01220 [Verrucomicrobiota bacterium]